MDDCRFLYRIGSCSTSGLTRSPSKGGVPSTLYERSFHGKTLLPQGDSKECGHPGCSRCWAVWLYERLSSGTLPQRYYRDDSLRRKLPEVQRIVISREILNSLTYRRKVDDGVLGTDIRLKNFESLRLFTHVESAQGDVRFLWNRNWNIRRLMIEGILREASLSILMKN